MPTPLDVLFAPTSLISFGIWFSLIALEKWTPGSAQPELRFWPARGLGALVLYLLLSSYLPLFTDEFLASYRLIDLTHLPALAGAVTAVLVYEAAAYFWHRSMHSSNFLWRTFHQIHHSPERLDAASAFYFSPLDVLGWTFVGSISMVFVIGVSPQATTMAMMTLFFLSAFQHTNIKTPKWLGYIIQRPESHSFHHARGVHRNNYSDLPIFDILFGTFRNPESFHQVGFFEGGSARLLEMLRFKDINSNTRQSF